MPDDYQSPLKGPRLMLPGEARAIAAALSISPRILEVEQEALSDVLSQLRRLQNQLDSVRASFARLEFKLELVTNELQGTRRIVAGMERCPQSEADLPEGGQQNED